MKNIIFIALLLIGFRSNAQQIILYDTRGETVEGAYYKDLNNELDPYLGTWSGTFEGKTFTITFSKFVFFNSLGNYTEDALAGKYTMKDAGGNLLYSTYNLSDDDAKVQSLGFVGGTNRTMMRFMFLDLCIEGEIHLNFDNPQKTQMHWKYLTMQTLVTDTSGCAPYNEMPRGEMTLIKQ